VLLGVHVDYRENRLFVEPAHEPLLA
jgi:hypothetical protein